MVGGVRAVPGNIFREFPFRNDRDHLSFQHYLRAEQVSQKVSELLCYLRK